MTNPHSFLLNDTLMNIIRHDIATTRIVPVLTGGPGFGKSSCLEDLAKEFDTKLFKMQINSYNEKGDLLGVRVMPKEDGSGLMQVYIPNEVIVAANDYAEEHPDKLVFVALEEYNRAEPDVTSAAMTIPTERKCGTTPIAPNIRFLATGNDKGNITEVDGASATRFAHYPVYPDLTTFLEITADHLHPLIKRTLRMNPDLIVSLPNVESGDDDAMFTAAFGDDERENLPHANPRTIEGMSNWLNSLTSNDTDTTLLRELFNTPAHGDPDSTVLEKSIIAHTGDTAFSDTLYAELVKSLTPATTRTKAHSTSLPAKPVILDHISQQNTHDGIYDILTRLNPSEIQEIITYLLTQNTTFYIEEVLPAALEAYPDANLDVNSMVTIVNLFTEDCISEEAITALENSNCILAENIHQFLSAANARR